MISDTQKVYGRRHSGPKAPAIFQPGCQRGFTLIEVVVALAIVVVSFMALYGVTLQMVNATTLMQEKTLASWIAFDKVTELRLKADAQTEPESSGITEMGGLTWLYSVEVRDTGSDKIRQVIITVAPEDEPERTLGLVSGVLVSNAPAGQFTAPATQPEPGQTPSPGSNRPVTSGASPDWGGNR